MIKNEHTTSGESAPWKLILINGLAFSLLMCGVYWLVEYSGKGSPPSENWLVNFAVWFMIGAGSHFTAWWAQSYFQRRNANKNDA
ncbi:hypothetical protein FUA23_06280 [Neolewinella aurantiaca]|uniref:Uncharacterized protein n=1 Tax=Neolewinella aurantiaca TaxID=2602767 RepID=A0A5C7FKG1_9BACT|nr:hypothetical protein [Neolewinella aurantiaca]TXF90394.1 hypothetical protein FUA23_06280 [Neolewinella aurantiaca]